MIATACIAGAAFLLLTLSILFLPTLRLGKLRLSTYWIVALVGAVVLVACGFASPKNIWEHLTATGDVNPLKILALFFSMTFLSVYLDEVGLFRHLASVCAGRAGHSQWSLFFVLYALTALLTVFTSNDVVILTLTPFICFFCKNTDVDPVPYLVGEFAAANTWSMMLVIGNPTNVYLSTYWGIGFVEYCKVMALPTVAAGVAQVLIIALVFWRKMRRPLSGNTQLYAIESKPDLAVGLAHLLLCLAFLVASGYVGIPMWLVAVAAALSLGVCAVVVRLVTRGGWGYLGHTLARLPWQLVPFVLSMFVIVIALDTQGVSGEIARVLGQNAPIWAYGGASAVASNLINNIPMSILFATLPQSLPAMQARQAVFATIVGSNVGAFLTPIGALAGIMFTSLIARYQVKYGFRQFIGYGLLVGLPTLAAALGVLCATAR